MRREGVRMRELGGLIQWLSELSLKEVSEMLRFLTATLKVEINFQVIKCPQRDQIVPCKTPLCMSYSMDFHWDQLELRLSICYRCIKLILSSHRKTQSGSILCCQSCQELTVMLKGAIFSILKCFLQA